MSGIIHPGKAWSWAALLWLAIPAAAQAQFTSGDYSYTIEYFYIDPTGVPITITGYSGPGGAVIMPVFLDGHPVEKIDQAFEGCGALTSVRTPDSGFFRTVGVGSFANCSNLANVVLCGAISDIGDYAFYGCTRLTNIALPSCPIGVEAFAWSGLRNVSISRYTTSIGTGAFSDCADLAAITVAASNTAFFSMDGVLFHKYLVLEQGTITNRIVLLQYPAGKPGAYSIPDDAVRVEPVAFSGCRNLTGVEFGEGVTNIGYRAFRGCSGLTEIEIPNRVRVLGNQAFESCTGLTNARVGTGVVDLQHDVFSQCSNLVTVVLGGGIATVGYGAFANCSALAGAYFPGTAPTLSGANWFDGATNATVYRLPGAEGWPAVPEPWAGRPTALWLPETKADASLGVQEGKFGFTIDWASGQTIVVEACTDLADPDWTPVGTNTFDGDSTTFSDAEWANLPGRFYRLCLP